MARNYIGDVGRIDYTNTTGSAIASGAPVFLPSGVGVALVNIAAGGSGPVQTVGTVEWPKAPGVAFSQLAPVYWDAANSRCSTTTGAYVGRAAKASAAGAATVIVGVNEGASAASLTASQVASLQAVVSEDGNTLSVATVGRARVWNPSALEMIRKKIAKGTVYTGRPAVVSVIGGSIVYGITTDGAATDSAVGDLAWPTRLSAILNGRLGVSVPPVIMNARDSRITNSGGSYIATLGVMGMARLMTQTGPASQTYSGLSFTTLEVDNFESNGTDGDSTTGTFSIAIDGGSATTVLNGGQARFHRQTVMADVSAGSHNVVLTGTSSGNAYPCAVMGYTKQYAGSGVAVGRFGRGGWTSADAIGQGAANSTTAPGQARLKRAIAKQLAPDVIVMTWGYNDSTQYTKAQFAGYLDQILDEIAGTVPVLLLAPPHGADDDLMGVDDLRSAYWDVLAAAAAARPTVCHARMADGLGTWAEAYADGFMVNSSVHCYPLGYARVAQFVADLLTP